MLRLITKIFQLTGDFICHYISKLIFFIMLTILITTPPKTFATMEGSYIGTKFAATLLRRALVENKIWRSDDWNTFTVPLSQKGKTKFYNIYRKKREMGDMGLGTHNTLSLHLMKLFPDEFSTIIRNDDGVPIWNIFGCPKTGRDYDVIVKVTDAQLPLLPGEMDNFEAVFREAYDEPLYPIFHFLYKFLERLLQVFLGIYNEKELDVCCISNKDGTYQTDHGGQETINICYHSYDWHPQKHSPFFEEPELVPMSVSDKLNTLSKFIMDKAETMLGKELYMTVRKEKQSAYNTGETRYQFTFKMWDMFNMNPAVEGWNSSIWKSIVMKLVQTYLVSKCPDYHKNPYPYDKEMLATKFGEYFPKWKDATTDILLYRYNESVPGFKEFLKGVFIELYTEYYPHLSEINYRVPLNVNPTTLPDNIFREFIKSPKSMSDEFYELWNTEFGSDDCGIDGKFMDECINIEMFDAYPTLAMRILKMAQRSPEWQEAYHHMYKTGRSGGIRNIPNEATHKEKLSLLYNLIMGCVGETMVMSVVSEFLTHILDDCEIATVGMIVEGDVGSRAFCPDAVGRLKETGELFPIEFKTIYSDAGPCNNNIWLRERNLAEKQLNGAVNVINVDSAGPITTFGMLFTMFIYPTDDGIKYDVYSNRIDFPEHKLYFD
jgi:hypothetical protein